MYIIDEYRRLKTFKQFCTQLHQLLGVGISLSSALQLMGQAQFKWGDDIALIQSHLRQGRSFGHSIQGILPQSIQFNAEALGDVPSLHAFLSQMAKYCEWKLNVWDSVSRALKYPLVLIVAVLGVLAVFLGIVLPGYAQFFGSIGLPFPPVLNVLLSVKGMVFRYWFLGLLGLGLAVAALKRSQRLRQWLAHNTPFQLADFLWSIGIGLQSGLSLLQISKALACPPEHPLAGSLMQFKETLTQTGQLSTSLERSFTIPPYYIQWLAHAEQSGQLNALILDIAQALNEAEKTKWMGYVKLVQPVMLVVLALLVWGIMMVVMLPLVNGLNAI